MELLSKPTANLKVSKNKKLKVLTAPLHLAPARISGYEVCPRRSKGCTKACLHTAGIPYMLKKKEQSRINKTKYFMENREDFLAQLVKDIAALERKSKRENMKCAVRLNATSDIAWEVIQVNSYRNIMDIFPDVQFYDYTKVLKRIIKSVNDPRWPNNYHLTFSKSEDNDKEVEEVLKAGGNVAVVMSSCLYKKSLEEGEWDAYSGFKIIDGEIHDYRPDDPVNCIVALKAKGKARNDSSGFVLR